MSKYDVIAFDLDGTLTNPERGLVAAFSYALDKMGIDYGDKENLKQFIGPPLFEEWQRVYGISAEKSSEALLVFREFYQVYGWWDNELYDGVAEMLDGLKRAGKKIILATSKPEHFAKKILKLFDIDKYFDFIGGAATDKTRDKKHEVLMYALNAVGNPEKSRCILVGDRKYDAEGARIVGISSLGVLYGHGSSEEISSSGFDCIVGSVSEISDVLLR